MTIPQAIESEKAMLCCMMLAPDKIIPDFIERGGREQYFFPHDHVIIFRQLIKMWQEKAHIDAITVTQALESAGALSKAGGAAYITELSILVEAASGWKTYADTLREQWICREAISIASGILNAAQGGVKELSQVSQTGLVKISSMFESRAKTMEMPELIKRAFDRAEDQKARGGMIQGITTGIEEFDRACRGFKPGQMITIAAPTKQGKSALALNIAMHNALKGKPTGVISLEMDADELTDRLLSSHSEIDMEKMASGGLSSDECDRFIEAGGDLSRAPLFIRDEAVMSPLEFQAAARKLHAQHKCKLIVVDYIQLMDPGSSSDNREREVARCSRTIKMTAKELGIPIIVLAQLNEFGRSRESRAIEQDSDLFVIIETDEASLEEGDMFIHIKYGRNVQRQKIPVTFKNKCVTFAGRAQ